VQISFNRRRTYTFETDLTIEEFFKRIAKACYNKRQAKDLGLFNEDSNKKNAIILRRSGDHFEVIKIVPTIYRQNGYKIKGKGKLRSGERKKLRVEIEYQISDVAAEMGFWTAVFFVFALGAKLFFEIIAGRYPTQATDYAILLPVAWILFSKLLTAITISGFNNDIRALFD